MPSTRLSDLFGRLLKICCVFIAVLNIITHNTCLVMRDSELFTCVLAVHLNSVDYTPNQLTQPHGNGVVTYSSLLARPRHGAPARPPPPSVCDRLRTLGLWAPCRLLWTRESGPRLVRRRGCRAGRRVKERKHKQSSADRLHPPPTTSTLLVSSLNVPPPPPSLLIQS